MPYNTDQFEIKYQKLNPAQREAVDTIDGPVMVVAGPGTGKTQILTLRIGHILRTTDTAASSILALTFTENAAANMRTRLHALIGPAAYKVWIGTFHGFCNDIIATYPEYFQELIGRKSANEVQLVHILEEVLTEIDVPLLKPFATPLWYVPVLKSTISQIKREGISPKNFSRIVAVSKKTFEDTPNKVHEKGKYAGQMKGVFLTQAKNIEKNMQVATVYAAYQEKLRAKGLYDFNDMILEVAATLQSTPELLQLLHERFQYVLVDEHQDTNNAQNKVLELLASYDNNPNLFIVGDEKQAIFRFQGASLENFLYFKKLYPTAKLIVLSSNYRSTQGLLDASHGVISNRARSLGAIIPELSEGISQALQSAHSDAGARAVICPLETSDQEAYYIAREVEGLINAGTLPQEIAILYRDNRDAREYAKVLGGRGIPHHVISRGNVLADTRIMQLLTLLEYIARDPEDELLAKILHFDFWRIPPMDIVRIISYQPKEKKRSLLEKLHTPPVLEASGVEDVQKIASIGQMLLSWKKHSHNMPVDELCQRIIAESGYIASIQSQSNAADVIEKIRTLFQEIQNLQTDTPGLSLVQVSEHIQALQNYGIALSYTPSIAKSSGVLLMTAHSAKGLEFDHVFLVGAADGHWGGRVTRDAITLPDLIKLETTGESKEEAGTEDERRLFYVAMTRARKGLTISYATIRQDGKPALPSQFIDEILPQHKIVKEKPIDEEEYQASITKGYANTAESVSSPLITPDYVMSRLYDRGISATAVNNYLECPIRYFYLNIVGLPSAQSRSQRYGSAIHATLKDVFDLFAISKTFDVTSAIASFSKHLQAEGLEGADYGTFIKKGTAAITGYIQNLKGEDYGQVKTELRVSGVVTAADCAPNLEADIKLHGALDRVDVLETNVGGGQSVRVIDYKTGKQKSKNKLEGNTKNADGNYTRQLLFYKLLLERSGIGFSMDVGRIDFVEPDEKGKYHAHDFLFSPEDVTQLYQTICTMIANVVSGVFLENGCRKDECEYCALFAQLKK